MSNLNVLIMGATGRIGPSFIEEYLKKYRLEYNLTIGFHNKIPSFDIPSVKIDLSDLDLLKNVFKNFDVIINLAGNSNEKEEDFNKFIEPNIIGAYNVLEAAKLANCKRVIFASSVHAIKGYELDYEVNEKDIQKPLNFYGATKVFGEALCHVYSSKYGLSCLAIRIGAYLSEDEKEKVCFERENYHYVITQRDFAQLIAKCVLAPNEIKFGILAGISNNKKRNMDLTFSKNLVGYDPEDDVYDLCKKLKVKE